MFNLILYQPEIPPNTGNIIRLCANAGAHLHLIGPYGFQLKDAQLKRAGLDYHDLAAVAQYRDWLEFREGNAELFENRRLWAFSTKGRQRYDRVTYRCGDGLLFGPESRGLPAEILAGLPGDQVLRIPMQASSRSMNLSNTAAIALFEALRQSDFQGLQP